MNSIGAAPTRAKTFAVAPMMDWTDRHCRMFHRLLTKRARLYTEMVTTGAIIHGPRARLLDYNAPEHPVALQLGGSNPSDLVFCAKIAEDYGYMEVNLNCGCPSDRVQNGAFGACLMAEPELVAQGVSAMKAAVKIRVTVKCRIGIDEQDPEIALRDMVKACMGAGVDELTIHARKAWLKGLSPKENRDIPPLDYDLVHRIKAENPGLPILLNGGLNNLAESLPHLADLEGVMLGRAAYYNPELLLGVDPEIYGEPAPFGDAFAALEAYEPYMADQMSQGVRFSDMARHLLGLFPGRSGARAYRRHLSEFGPSIGADALAGLQCLREAVSKVERESVAA